MIQPNEPDSSSSIYFTQLDMHKKERREHQSQRRTQGKAKQIRLYVFSQRDDRNSKHQSKGVPERTQPCSKERIFFWSLRRAWNPACTRENSGRLMRRGRRRGTRGLGDGVEAFWVMAETRRLQGWSSWGGGGSGTDTASGGTRSRRPAVSHPWFPRVSFTGVFFLVWMLLFSSRASSFFLHLRATIRVPIHVSSPHPGPGKKLDSFYVFTHMGQTARENSE